MTTRSAVLGRYRTTGAKESHLVFTCPTGTVALVKSVQVFSRASPDVIAQVWITRPDDQVETFVYHETPQFGVPSMIEVWVVMEPAAQLNVYAEAPDVSFQICGALLPAA